MCLLRYLSTDEPLYAKTCLPLKVTLPWLGVSNPPRMCRSVDFPEPEAPSIEMNCPWLIVRLTLLSICRSSEPTV